MTHVNRDPQVFILGNNNAQESELDLSCPYEACRVCGVIWQYPLARKMNITPAEVEECELERKKWRMKHFNTHNYKEYHWLAQTGNAFTPLAAERLAPYGIVDLRGIIFDDEIKDAYAKAPRKPEQQEGIV